MKEDILLKLSRLNKEFNDELQKIEMQGNTVKVVYNKKTNKDELHIVRDNYENKNNH